MTACSWSSLPGSIPRGGNALHIVKPDTLLGWHKRLFKLFWRFKSKPKGQP